MKTVELLLPAKNKNIAIDAINFGADAIYIGYEKFGARVNAANNIQDIKEVINFAHIFNVKVYVTLNTILEDTDLKEIERIIQDLYDIKTDAIIIQDFGILQLKLPAIKLFASTQMANETKEKVQFLAKAGFSRVILARELSLDQIENITQNVDNIEIETFIHGSLCVCFSGRCYLSYVNGARSANKGQCAQPCRKKYTLIDEHDNIIIKNKHLLSLKDFNSSKHLKKLVDINVSSFKIEGRLKDSSYVKNVCAFYRQALDKISKKTSLGEFDFDFEPNLDKTFNRGYCDYFLQKRQKIANFDSPKALGQLLGYVKKSFNNTLTLKYCSYAISPQDGICFFNKKNKLCGALVNKVEGEKIYLNQKVSLNENQPIWRNFDCQFEKKLKNSKTKRYLKAQITISFINDKIEFKITDETGLSFVKKIDKIFETAKNQLLAKENFITQLKKSKESIFKVTNINIKNKNLPFISKSELNSIRNELFESLKQKRLQNYKPDLRQIQRTNHNYPKLKAYYDENILNEKAKDFLSSHNCEVVEMSIEKKYSKLKNRKVMETKYCILYEIGKCKKMYKNYRNKILYLQSEDNKKYRLSFDCKNCKMEIYSL